MIIQLYNNNISDNNSILNIKSFDELFDVSHIDDYKKIILLLSNSKIPSALENILENDINLNVLIDTTSDNCIIYDGIIKKLNKYEIAEKVIDKIYIHLSKFYDDIVFYNILNINHDVITIEYKVLSEIYDEYKKNHEILDKIIIDIINKKNIDTFNIFERNGY